MKFQIPRLTAIGLLGWALPVSAELTIPAFTAYTLPNPDAARISEQSGVTRWNDPETTVNWFGQFNATGALNAKVTLRLDKRRGIKTPHENRCGLPRTHGHRHRRTGDCRLR